MTSQENRTQQAPPPWAAGTENRQHELNPELTEDQINIVRRYGEEREIADGTLLWNIGDRKRGFFLVLEGKLEIFRRTESGEHVIITHGRGHYGGETTTLSAGGALLAGRAKGRTRVLAVSTEKLRELIAIETTLSETILLSFILRRMRMIAERLGGVTLVGSSSQRDTGRIRTFLTRNGVPHEVVDVDRGADIESRVQALHATATKLPLLICDPQRLTNPSNREIAECLGFAAELREGAEYDVAIIGAGPAGLAAAVYAASEGLSVVVIESCAVGGQAGTSSKIENYLGFPTGISGQALAGRAYIQAVKFGAEIAVACELTKLYRGDPFHTLELDGADRIRARSIVIASGAIYRQPPIEGLETFDGSSVHYGASYIEGQFCHGKNVAIVGGGNSAGQAAVYLSDHARKVSIIVRGEGLAESMSDYLIRRIDRTENIELLPNTEVERIEGNDRISALVIRDNRNGETRRLQASHLFIFIGAQPATSFASDDLILDNKGFVKTGDALSIEELDFAGWKLTRRPHLLETSCPRVFAAGDVRAGSVKRVASAVGEGSICVQFIHQTLTADANA
ncbi:MAG TPA: FAD-dependent oxidoreductase [Burkholderiales bacterium]|nr:FAD-dependent oxidoreductase [Burkholderiales bacterium]